MRFSHEGRIFLTNKRTSFTVAGTNNHFADPNTELRQTDTEVIRLIRPANKAWQIQQRLLSNQFRLHVRLSESTIRLEALPSKLPPLRHRGQLPKCCATGPSGNVYEKGPHRLRIVVENGVITSNPVTEPSRRRSPLRCFSLGFPLSPATARAALRESWCELDGPQTRLRMLDTAHNRMGID